MKKLILFTIFVTIASTGYAKVTRRCSDNRGITCLSEFGKPVHVWERPELLEKVPTQAQNVEAIQRLDL